MSERVGLSDLGLGESVPLPVIAGCGCVMCDLAGGAEQSVSAADAVGYLALSGQTFVDGQAAQWRWTDTDAEGRVDLSYAFATSTEDLNHATSNANSVFSSDVIASSGAHARFDVSVSPTTGEAHAADLKSDILIGFDMLENVAAMSFTESVNGFQSDETDFKMLAFETLSASFGGLNGRGTFPGYDGTGNSDEPYEAYQIYDVSRSSMVTDPEQGAATNRLHVAIHETMHSLGVYHPHETAFGRNWTANGNTAAGDNVLDNDRYTVMSYERGGLDTNTQWLSYGYAATPMVIDIAVLRHLYGSVAAHEGDTVYTLTDPRTADADFYGDDGTVSIGRAFYAIADTGGTDTLAYSGTRHGLLNLNNATLNQTGDTEEIQAIIDTLTASPRFAALLPTGTANELRNDLLLAEWHAGGFGSRIFDSNGAADLGGYYIAADDFADPDHATRIENATGSAQADILIGNGAANVLTGNGGDDLMIGSGGADTLLGGSGSEELDGGEGADEIAPGSGIDTVRGGAGDDRLRFAEPSELGSGDSIDGGGGTDLLVLTASGASATYQLGLASLTGIEGIAFDDADTALTATLSAGLMGAMTELEAVAGAAVTIAVDMGTETALDLSGLGLTGFDAASHAVTITGDGDVEAITGSALDEVITAGGGSDTVEGGAGADTLTGGDGTDLLSYAGAPQGVDVTLGGTGSAGDAAGDTNSGFEILQGSAHGDSLRGQGSDDTIMGGDGADLITGGAGANQLDGGDGADTLTGGGGAETLLGGDGDDLARDFLSGFDRFEGGAGQDTVEIADAALVGMATLDGGTGTDLLTVTSAFAANHDFRSANLISFEELAFADGIAADTTLTFDLEDFIFESVTYGTNTAALTIVIESDGSDVDLSGLQLLGARDANDTITLRGTDGGEQLIGAASGQTLEGEGGDDTLTGSGMADHLMGGEGHDSLIGGAGGDTLVGGAGDDVYVVDDAGDQVTEAQGEGRDVVHAGVDFDLRDHSVYLEDLVLSGSASRGIGNARDNVITANDSGNTLNGAYGDDLLIGGAGDDIFTDAAGADTFRGGAGDDLFRVDSLDTVIEEAGGGWDTIVAQEDADLPEHVEALRFIGEGDAIGNGNDLDNLLLGNRGDNTLAGGTGADTMRGGTGDDVYLVENAGDVVREGAGGGEDTVATFVDFALRSHSKSLEHLVLSGTGDLSGTGNGLDNRITGNLGNNTLNGAFGDDTLIGGAGDDVFADDRGADRMEGGTGDDVYDLDHRNDQIIEAPGEGIDTVVVSRGLQVWRYSQEVEVIQSLTDRQVTGNALDNVMFGDDGANRLNGGRGDDTVQGGAGVDTLIGGSGADVFQLTTGADGIDLIQDFRTGVDGLAIVADLALAGALSEAAFHLGTEALTADHRVIYDPLTGRLAVDLDGVGGDAAIKLAELVGQPILTAADIEIL